MIYVCDIGRFNGSRHEAQRVCMRDFEACEVYVYSRRLFFSIYYCSGARMDTLITCWFHDPELGQNPRINVILLGCYGVHISKSCFAVEYVTKILSNFSKNKSNAWLKLALLKLGFGMVGWLSMVRILQRHGKSNTCARLWTPRNCILWWWW